MSERITKVKERWQVGQGAGQGNNAAPNGVSPKVGSVILYPRQNAGNAPHSHLKEIREVFHSDHDC